MHAEDKEVAHDGACRLLNKQKNRNRKNSGRQQIRNCRLHAAYDGHKARSGKGQAIVTSDSLRISFRPQGPRTSPQRLRTLARAMFLCLCVLGSSRVSAQTASVRGFVTSADDGESLQGVNIVIDDMSGGVRGIATNRDGFFLISRIAPGRQVLRASYTGFVTVVDTLQVKSGDRIVLSIALETGELEMDEIAVEAEREGGAGMQTVRARDIERIPTLDVSGDLVSYLSTVPSVVLMGDRGGQVFIRGGEPTQNMILLDGIDIFQPFHVLGFYSAFPSEIVSRVDLYAGGYPGRYMGRISSVLDVRTRNGNKNTINASAALSPFTGSAHVEGPLIKGRVSVLGAGRLSTLRRLARQYVADPLPYHFSDLFGKMHVVASQNSQLSLTVLDTYDRGTLTAEDDFFERKDVIRWRNTAVGGRYLFAPTALSVLGEFLVTYSRLQSEFGPAAAPNRTADVRSVSTSLNMTYFTGPSEISWGFFFRAPTTEAELDGLYQNLITRKYISSHTGAYIDSEIYLGAGLRVRPGLAVQAFGSAPISLEPRLRMRLDLGRYHVNGAVGLYRQHFIGLADRRDATSIFTAWIETPRNVPMRALHMIFGQRIEIAPGVELSVEGFRKEMDNIYISEWTAFPSFTTRLQTASGTVNGVDVRLDLRHSRFFGFVTYGLSSTRYEVNPDSPAAIDPGKFRPPHDRRHQVNVVAAADLYGFTLSTRWQFGSGLPYTPVQGFDGFILMDRAVDVARVRGFPRVIYESVPYRAQLPAYHRLDVTLERKFELIRSVDMTVQLGVLNAYDRNNLFALDLLTTQRSDQLPIIPVIGTKVEF